MEVTNAGGKKVGAAAVARQASHRLKFHRYMSMSFKLIFLTLAGKGEQTYYYSQAHL